MGQRDEDYKPLLYFEPYISNHNIFQCERELANRLAAILTTPQAQVDAEKLAAALQDVIARPVIVQGEQIVLTDEQCKVVAASARTGLTVVSGGPGTGKTSIVVAIMRLMVRMGVEPSKIVLAAPTGKAALSNGRMRQRVAYAN